MEGLGVAANVIAVVDLSAKVAALCVQYSKKVAGAQADILRLQTQVEHLGNALRATQRLVEGIKGRSLVTSQELVASFRDCIADLERLEKALCPNPARTAMRRLGLRALKWPFSCKEVDQILSSLERHEKTILLGLQIDQTSVLVDIHEGVKQLGLQASEDATISRKAHRMVPFPPDPDFVHRPSIEKWMQDQYNGPGQRMALAGMGGFGKSQLAIEFAHKVHTDKPGTSVFWVHGANRATFEESYRALADVLALPRRHEPDVDVLGLVRDWLQRDDISPWFMVLDNADDVGVFFLDKGHNNTSQEPLASYLPKSINGRILVTSRSLDAAEKLVGSSRAILRILVMGEDQALELLRKRLEGEADEAATIELVHALDCIPLAVSQAAAYVNRRSPMVSITSYLDEFRKSEKRKDSLLRSDKGDLGRHDAVSNSVVVTWQLTFEQIGRERPRAAQLLSLMSQFQAQNIPEDMLHSYGLDVPTGDEGDADGVDTRTEIDEESERQSFEDDIDVLRGYSLVTLSAAGLYEMHALVQFCTRSWISGFGNPGRWSRLFMKLAADHFPSGKFETWDTCQRLLPHIEPVLSRKAREQADILDRAELLTNVCRYIVTIGEYSRAEVLGEEAVQARRNILGADHPETLTSMSNLVSTLWERGRWEEAEILGVEVIETRKAKLGADHLDTLTSMNNLASVFWSQGRWEEAETLQVEVIELRKAKLGADHPDTLTSMSNLASTLWSQGRWEEAETLDVEVMETRKVKLGADHPDTLTSMTNLASTLSSQGRWEEAETLQVEVIELCKAKLGADHPETLTSMSNLASTLWSQGRWEEAETLEVEVIELRKAKLGADHPNTLLSMNNLAFTWHDQGRQEDALAMMQECVCLREKTLGPSHPATQSSLEALQFWQSGCRAAEGDLSS